MRVAESGGNDVIIPDPRDEAINWYINRGIRGTTSYHARIKRQMSLVQPSSIPRDTKGATMSPPPLLTKLIN